MKNPILIAYYMILIIILVLWGNTEALPPLPLRMIFLLSVVTPLFLKARDYFFIVFFFFVILSGSNHAVSYMPATGLSLIVCALLGALVFKPANTVYISMPVSFWLLMLLTIVVNYFSNLSFENLSYAFVLTIIVTSGLITNNSVHILRTISFSFILLTLILSLEYFIWGNQFTNVVTIGGQDFERSGWSDPNYFSCVLGFGTLISFVHLVNRGKTLRKKIKVFYISIVIISLSVIIATASRGAIISLLAAAISVVMCANTQIRRKLLIISACSILILLCYKLGFFDLLVSRFVNDDGTAGDRTLIWSTKLSEFANSEFLSIIFGHGQKGGLLLGFNKLQGFHNDFLAFLVCYGLIGFILFVSVLLAPIWKARDKKVALPYVTYMSVICMSLEPMSAGNLIYFYFYIYIILLVKHSNNLIRSKYEVSC